MTEATENGQPPARKSLEEKKSAGNPQAKVGRESILSIIQNKPGKSKEKPAKSKVPLGGYDDVPVPQARPGLTVRLTFVRATNLPTADISNFSSDPYIVADITTAVPTRHKEDPPLRFRTRTIHHTRNPVWDAPWIIGNMPRSGFKLKARIYDEDGADKDDRLGNAHLALSELNESSPGDSEREIRIRKRMGSKRAFLLTSCVELLSGRVHSRATLVIRVEVLGLTEGPGGKVHTIGPQYWSKHFSPMIGRMIGTKVPGKQGKPERYNFQANQIQLRGPVPDQLYHRYVEFRPYIKGMFTGVGLRGRILNHFLHHQHDRVYNFDRSTIYGAFPAPSTEMTLQFLDMVHYDRGGRIFTYVLMLDGLFRFTETGKEFGIDLLSKHSMHSDVCIYVAWSGEFFVRQRKQRRWGSSYSSGDPAEFDDKDNHQYNDKGPEKSEPPRDPSRYELIIDNESGTYRPKPELLPLLAGFLRDNLPGLHIRALANSDDELARLKRRQRERKKAQGGMKMYIQQRRRRRSTTGSSSSISSSDIEDLNERARMERDDDDDEEDDNEAPTSSSFSPSSASEGPTTSSSSSPPQHHHPPPSAAPTNRENRLEKGLKLVAEPKEFIHRWATGEI